MLDPLDVGVAIGVGFSAVEPDRIPGVDVEPHAFVGQAARVTLGGFAVHVEGNGVPVVGESVVVEARRGIEGKLRFFGVGLSAAA